MVNKTIIKFFIVLSVIFQTQCNRTVEKPDSEPLPFNITKTTGTTIHKDSVLQPVPFIPEPPDRIPIKAPDTVIYKSNIAPAGNPIITKAGPPQKNTPGVGSYAEPEIVLASERIIYGTNPQPVEAKDANVREYNPFSFTFYSKLQGLTHDDVSSIMEDNAGNIWIGTYGGGITRFDGKFFTHFDESVGLSNNAINSIIQDKNEDMWFATWGGGATKYDGYSYTHYTENEGLKSNYLLAITEDYYGNIWFSYWEEGVTKFDGKYFTHYNKSNGLGGNTVFDIIEDNNNNLWFGMSDGGISRYDGNSFYNYSSDKGLPGNNILSLHEDTNNNIWIGTNGYGVIKYDGEFFYNYNTSNGLNDNFIASIMEDNNEQLWFGTWNGGANVFDGKFFKYYTKDTGLNDNYVRSMYNDSKGNIWLGFMSGGLSRYYGDVFTHLNKQDGLINNYITPVFEDTKGRLVIGDNIGGFSIFDGNKFYQYTNNQGFMKNYVWHGLIDSQGRMWLSGDHGVSYLQDDAYYQYSTRQGLLRNYIFHFTEDSNNNFWFAISGGGVTKFDGTYFTNYTDEHGLPDNFTYYAFEDSKGNMWFATWGGGACMFDGETFTIFDESNGLANNYVFQIIEDKFGNIWFTTNGNGLSVFTGEYIINFSETEGLANNYVLSALEDNQNNLWFGTRFGLSKISAKNLGYINSINKNDYKADVSNKVLFENYTYADGFLGMGCNRNSIFQDSREVLWVGANDRLTAFNTNAVTPDTIPPKVKITGIGLFNERIDWGSILNNQDTTFILGNGVQAKNFSFDNISRWYSIPKNLKLAHNNNHITISFVGITTLFAQKVTYSYKLEGFDKEWHTPTSRNEAHYGNLPAGSYTFKLKGFNSLGYSSDIEYFLFIIKPPWWQTWWAYTLYFLSFALLFYWFIRYREKSLLLENKLLNQEVEIAHKSLEFKKNFLANMSHEIRTPLTGIIGITDILFKTDLKPEQKTHLITLKQSGENLKEIINLILDYSKIEAGQVKLKNEPFSLEDIFIQNKTLFHTLADSDKISFNYEISPDIPKYLVGDRYRINQVVNNLVSNAVKFTNKGMVSLKAVLVNDNLNDTYNKDLTIKIHVIDTGIGIKEEQQKNLFIPFSQIEHKDVREMDSTGLGLAISKDLSQIMGGDIGVNSKPGKGSDFWFTFKAKKADQLENQIKAESPLSVNIKPLKILYVEDKQTNRTVVKIMLESMGHNVEVAENGKEALSKFQPGLFDLVLMDIQMPVMDGITATQTIKSKYSNPPPIIGLSANAFEGDREKYMKMGLDEYITKPINERDITFVFSKFFMSE